MKRIPAFILLLSLLALSACSPDLPEDLTPTPTAAVGAAAPSPTVVSTPAVSFPSLVLLPGQQPGDWRVVGLVENQSTQSLLDTRLTVSLQDSTGNTLAEIEVPITFTHLAPHEISPFSAGFQGVGLASEAQAQVSSYVIGSFQRVSLDVEVESSYSSSRGGQAILATVTNPGERAASITALALMPEDDRGRPLGLAVQVAGPSLLRAGESAVLLALLDIDAGGSTYTPFVDAISADLMPDPQPVSLAGQPQILFDNQDHPFVIGAFTNNSQQPFMSSATLIVSIQGRPVSAAQLRTPIPLEPGEMRPFSVYDFPGLVAGLSGSDWSPEDLEVEARLDPQLAGAESDPYALLNLSFRAYEVIGGFAYLQGSVTNPHVYAIQDASVMAALYDSRGRLVTAAWLSAPEVLLAAQSYAFVLSIPIPARATPRLAEFDTWAAGVIITDAQD